MSGGCNRRGGLFVRSELTHRLYAIPCRRPCIYFDVTLEYEYAQRRMCICDMHLQSIEEQDNSAHMAVLSCIIIVMKQIRVDRFKVRHAVCTCCI